MTNDEKKNLNALSDDELNRITGGFVGGRYKGMSDCIEIGDVVEFGGMEYVCYYNSKNEILRFCRYSPNHESDLCKMEIVDQDALYCHEWTIVRRGEIDYLRSKGFID